MSIALKIMVVVCLNGHKDEAIALLQKQEIIDEIKIGLLCPIALL